MKLIKCLHVVGVATGKAGKGRQAVFFLISSHTKIHVAAAAAKALKPGTISR